MGGRHLYLVKRGPKPDYHAAPFHPVLLTDWKCVAEWEAGWSGDHAWVWEAFQPGPNVGGWLLVRWNGFPIDYGHVVRSLTLPDGNKAAFWRDYETRDGEEGMVGPLLPGAVWYSERKLPEWLVERGVVYPSDHFTQQHILDCIANRDWKKGGSWGCGREIPSHWPEPVETTT
jgi:hypothetical protein